MKSKLALTPDQTRAVTDLNLKYATKMESVIRESRTIRPAASDARDQGGEGDGARGHPFRSSTGRSTTTQARRCGRSSRSGSSRAAAVSERLEMCLLQGLQRSPW